MPTIVVLVKNVPDSWSEHSLNPDYTLDRESVTEVIDEINEYAVEKALALRDSNEGFRVVALSAGPERAEDARCAKHSPWALMKRCCLSTMR